jgi:electron transport complex protein RnfD
MASQEVTSKNLFSVSAAPVWHCGRTVRSTMLHSLLALLPAAIMAVYRYGYDAIAVIAWAGLAAVVTEFLMEKWMERESTADDFTALFDGVVFAFLLPSTAPIWLVVIGSSLTIVLGRMVFGGFGGSPICAPAVGWAIMTVSWPEFMDLNAMLLNWDLVEPLSDLKYFGVEAITDISYTSLLFGQNLGALGASQVLLIAVGGIYLLATRQLRWFIPISFLAGVYLTGLIYNIIDPTLYASPLFHLLSGGTMLAAFFLMPYPSSSPTWKLPMLLFGFLGGALLIIIRTYGIYPDGTCFAVLLINLCTPLIDLIQPKPSGGR